MRSFLGNANPDLHAHPASLWHCLDLSPGLPRFQNRSVSGASAVCTWPVLLCAFGISSLHPVVFSDCR